MSEITISTSSASYPVHIGPGVLALVAGAVGALPGRVSGVFVVTSPEIDELWGDAVTDPLRRAGYTVCTMHVAAGEAKKRLTTVEALCEQMANSGADRDALLIAVGGGVLGDITGFLASIYMRGVRFMQVPTTLLAQVDSSVGGKTGVNLAAGKNLAGSFHQPVAVFADIDTLRTLPTRELRAGLQESLKSAIIRDPALFEYMESNAEAVLAGEPAALQHVVEASVRVKAAVVGEDEFETGVRATLNFGHTLGHAIEAATHYTGLLHGEAVGWGMIAAVRMAELRNAIDPPEATRIIDLIRRYAELPAFSASADKLVELTARDKKKRSGVLNFVLPVGIGRVELVRDVTEEQLHAAVVAMLAEMHATGYRPGPAVEE